MKITIFATIALSAVVGMTLADEMWNNNNNNNNFGGIVGGVGGIGSIGGGQFSSGIGSGYGLGSGYSSGYGSGSGYSSGIGSGYGSGSGYSSGYSSGYGSGSGYGYGGVQAQYVPVPATGGNAGFGIGSLLPLFGLLFLLPLLFQGSTGTQDQIILLNTTLEG